MRLKETICREKTNGVGALWKRLYPIIIPCELSNWAKDPKAIKRTI